MGYAITVSLISILLGTIPIGYDAWPNIIGILIGAGLVVGFVYGLCAPVLSSTGRFDPMTELVMMIQRMRGGEGFEMDKLKEDTVKAFNGEYVEDNEQDGKVLEEHSETSAVKHEEQEPVVIAEEEP